MTESFGSSNSKSPKAHAKKGKLSIPSKNRNVSESELNLKSSMFHNIFQNTPIGIIVFGLDEKTIDSNPALEKIIGYKKHEISTKIIKDLICTDDEPNDSSIFDSLVKGKQDFIKIEKRFKRKDKKTIWFKLVLSTIKDSENKVISIMGMIEDITWKKTEEEKSTENEEGYLSLVETSQDLIWRCDVEGRFTFLNKAWEKTHGYALKDMLGKKFTEFQDPEAAERDLIEFKKHLAGGSVMGYETTHRNKNGKPIHLLFNSNPIMNEVGEIIGTQGTAYEITDKNPLEENLKKSENRYKTLFENSPVPLLELDLTNVKKFIDKLSRMGDIDVIEEFIYSNHDDVRELTSQIHILQLNQAVIKLFGAKNRKDLFNNVPGFCFLRSSPPIRRGIAKIASGERSFEFEGSCRNKDGNTIPSVFHWTVIEDFESSNLRAILSIFDLTDHKKLSKAMRESEEKFRTLAEKSPNMIFINRGGKVIYANEKCEEILGYSKDEFYSPEFNYFQLIDDDSIDVVQNAYQKHQKGEDIPPYEYTLVSKLGEKLDVILTSKLINYEGKRSILGILTDITDRKRTEEELRESAFYLDTMPDALVVATPDLEVIKVNKAFSRLWDYEGNEVIGRSTLSLFADEELAVHEYELSQGMTSGSIRQFETKALTKGGKKIPISLVGRFLKDDNGEVIAVIAIIQDISKRKKAEEELRESKEQYYSTINSIPDLIHVIDRDMKLIMCNNAFKNEASDFIEGDPVGKTLPELFPFLTQRVWDEYSWVIESGDALFTDEVTTINDQEIITETRKIPVFNENGRVKEIVTIIRNITEKKKASDALRESEERYRKLFQRTANPIFVIDESGNYVDCNDAGLSFMECDSNELLTRNIKDFLISGPVKDFHGGPNNAILSSNNIENEYSIHGKSKFIEYNMIRSRWNNLSVYIAIGVDMTHRRQMARQLKESEQKFRSIYEQSPIAILLINSKGKLIDVNHQGCMLLGVENVEDIDNESLIKLFKFQDNFLNLSKRTSNEVLEFDFDYAKKVKALKTKETGTHYFDVFITSFGLDEHTSDNFLLQIIDITERKKAEEILKKTLDEKETLFRELKHRIKNNLQLLASMVSLQVMRTSDIAVAKKLEEVQSVIDTMALIYNRAFDSIDVMGLNLNDFIDELIGSLLKFKFTEDIDISYEVDGEKILLNTDKAIPLALITNEIVFNSLKHAFKGRSDGHISVLLQKETNSMKLIIGDNGVGFPPDVNIDNPKNLGLRIVNNLTKQVNGEMERLIEDGTKYILKIPLEEEG